MSERIENWEEQTFPLVEAAKELKAASEAYGKMVAIGIHSKRSVRHAHDHSTIAAWQPFADPPFLARRIFSP